MPTTIPPPEAGIYFHTANPVWNLASFCFEWFLGVQLPRAEFLILMECLGAGPIKA